MRLPKNIISENLYTSGNEFVDATTNSLYQGYYYEINGKFYAGGTFDSKAPEIIKIKEEVDMIMIQMIMKKCVKDIIQMKKKII